MLKDALSNGYSSQVRGWLIVSGVQHELSQVGPDFCIIREPKASETLQSSDTLADLIIEVDGNQRSIAVILTSSHASFPRRLQFRPVHDG